MDEIRKNYYWEKVKKYEDENEDIDPNVVSSWVKLGNLNEDEGVHKKSHFITIKIEKVKLERI